MGQAPGASPGVATPNNRRFRRFANEAALFTTTAYAGRNRFLSGLTSPSLGLLRKGRLFLPLKNQNPPTPHAQADFSNFKI